jgi:hypothetical protein
MKRINKKVFKGTVHSEMDLAKSELIRNILNEDARRFSENFGRPKMVGAAEFY